MWSRASLAIPRRCNSAFADAVNIKDVGRDLGTNFNSRYSNYASAIGGNAVSPAIALKSRVKSVKMSKLSTSNVGNDYNNKRKNV